MDEEQLQFLERALKEAGDRPVAIFTHAPIMGSGLKVWGGRVFGWVVDARACVAAYVCVAGGCQGVWVGGGPASGALRWPANASKWWRAQKRCLWLLCSAACNGSGCF